MQISICEAKEESLRLGRLDADAINALVEKERKGVHHE